MAKIAEMKETVAIPEKVEATLNQDTLTLKGEQGSISRVFSHPKIKVKINGKVIEITCKLPRRQEKALAGSFKAHIKNMTKGVAKGYECKMKTVFAHFPIKTAVEGNNVLIHNFLGERSPRRAKILQGVNVDIKGEHITLKGIDIEKVGQTAANIERATSVKNRDIRVFQDGIYVTSKPRR